MLTGVGTSALFIVLSAPVWPGADSTTGSPLGTWALDNPAIYTIPLGFLGCYVGTLLGHERGAERSYHELYVRAETGLTRRAPRARRAAGSMATHVLPK